MFKKILASIVAVVLLAIIGIAISGKIAPVSWNVWGNVNNESGLAAAGYDVVSYQTESRPVKGIKAHRSRWSGVEWHFSSRDNKLLFDSDPERYAPKYGGYCAYAVMKGVTADVDPLIWHVQNDELYFFASDAPRESWVGSIVNGAIKTSDQNWASRN